MRDLNSSVCELSLSEVLSYWESDDFETKLDMYCMSEFGIKPDEANDDELSKFESFIDEIGEKGYDLRDTDEVVNYFEKVLSYLNSEKYNLEYYYQTALEIHTMKTIKEFENNSSLTFDTLSIDMRDEMIKVRFVNTALGEKCYVDRDIYFPAECLENELYGTELENEMFEETSLVWLKNFENISKKALNDLNLSGNISIQNVSFEDITLSVGDKSVTVDLINTLWKAVDDKVYLSYVVSKSILKNLSMIKKALKNSSGNRETVANTLCLN